MKAIPVDRLERILSSEEAVLDPSDVPSLMQTIIKGADVANWQATRDLRYSSESSLDTWNWKPKDVEEASKLVMEDIEKIEYLDDEGEWRKLRDSFEWITNYCDPERGALKAHNLAVIKWSQIDRIGIELVHGTESLVMHITVVERSENRERRWDGRVSTMIALKGFDDELVFAVHRFLVKTLLL
jgi:hypothetical protein